MEPSGEIGAEAVTIHLTRPPSLAFTLLKTSLSHNQWVKYPLRRPPVFDATAILYN